jgi:diguanylate cyclase (GGDEF)-like protein
MSWSNKIRITVYADMSCPFCFVLHERLLTLKLLDKVEWRTIEHAPGANASTRDPRQIEQLNQEYRMILKRAGDVKVANPGFIPNTSLVNQYLYQVSKQFPDRIGQIRMLLYRALWQQGVDISDKAMLEALLQEQGIVLTDIESQVYERLARWQRKWQFADFDLRIPVMLRDQTEVMLGLQNAKSVTAFIDFQSLQDFQTGDICRFISKDTILVLCNKAYQQPLTQLADSEKTALLFYHGSAQLLDDMAKKRPDLLLLDESIEGNFELCQQAKTLNGLSNDLPTVFLSQDLQRVNESKAFRSGAIDYICFQTQTDALFSRLKNHIRIKHRLDILSDHAAYDGLTGLYNKVELENCLEREWRYACRYRHSLAVLMLDIDHFKAYNSFFGHPTGDEALIKISSAISGCVFRGTDVVARYGGEAFAIILPNTDKKSLLSICERIKAAVEKQNIQHQPGFEVKHLTVSIGAGLSQAHADNNFLMLIELAEQCLYQAKSAGRNCIQFDELSAPGY